LAEFVQIEVLIKLLTQSRLTWVTDSGMVDVLHHHPLHLAGRRVRIGLDRRDGPAAADRVPDARRVPAGSGNGRNPHYQLFQDSGRVHQEGQEDAEAKGQNSGNFHLLKITNWTEQVFCNCIFFNCELSLTASIASLHNLTEQFQCKQGDQNERIMAEWAVDDFWQFFNY
jgi:hypothetical protein